MPKKKPGRNRRKPSASNQSLRTAKNKMKRVRKHVEENPNDHQSAAVFAQRKKDARSDD